MTWAVPEHPHARVDRAGATLISGLFSPVEWEEALEIVNNWRSSHSFPMNTFQTTLRRNARLVDARSLVAQRLKRLSSTQAKLLRFPTLRLSQMQDIGGCRAVVSSAKRVDELREIYRKSDLKHTLVKEDDYIRKPKGSGYRSIHLIYRYHSDRSPTYEGLLIELQLRSRLQHAWATAVETVGTFLQQALKSSEGPEKWLWFFSLIGSAFARREGTPPVPGTPTSKTELLDTARRLARELDVNRRLESYGEALKVLEDKNQANAKYFLLELRPAEDKLLVVGYEAGMLNRATSDYLKSEKSLAGQPGAQAVLVSAESLESLRRAYPNFFLDTHAFLQELKEALKP